jgi:hypothetical protein
MEEITQIETAAVEKVKVKDLSLNSRKAYNRISFQNYRDRKIRRGEGNI